MNRLLMAAVCFLGLYTHQSVGTEWVDVGLDWTNPNEWVWIKWGFKTPIPTRVFSGSPGSLLLHNNPTSFHGPIYTKTAYGPGKKVFYIEWVGNEHSNTVIQLLSKQLMTEGQFSPSNCWPNCGEIDVYEMLRAWGTASPAYGAPANYGVMQLHTGARGSHCYCPSRGVNDRWFQGAKPMSSSCSAEFTNRPNAKNSIATIIDQDQSGHYIQFIQDPQITTSGGVTTFSVGSNSTATQKIYNNGLSFYGISPPSTCPQGSPQPTTGWPFFNQPMHLVVWEQDYGNTLGQFLVKNVKVFLPRQ